MIENLKEAQEQGIAPWTDLQYATKEYAVYKDKYPVTDGHLLIVPKEATVVGITACFRAALEIANLNVEENGITGYNIGLNVGASAGQTVMYPHVHLIFRRDGDMEDPRGGVRGVIPEKQKY